MMDVEWIILVEDRGKNISAMTFISLSGMYCTVYSAGMLRDGDRMRWAEGNGRL